MNESFAWNSFWRLCTELVPDETGCAKQHRNTWKRSIERTRGSEPEASFKMTGRQFELNLHGIMGTAGMARTHLRRRTDDKEAPDGDGKHASLTFTQSRSAFTALTCGVWSSDNKKHKGREGISSVDSQSWHTWSTRHRPGLLLGSPRLQVMRTQTQTG